ncbi:hypothetical protein QR97_01705 [Streptomyces sp. PBH53]|uniref:hypothetical protein n=1 Tax=Streptomyces sp. PBH53 TaxID=1577075 RepID=UPI00065579C4|nr:hypothetical protein [Streptomyces sp. PBH53]AKN68691.1 hypothetical protein QR97_01705 [Streptomyces sp. PBH53]
MPDNETRPEQGQVWANPLDSADIIEVLDFDGAYAKVFARKFGQEIMVNVGHFGGMYELQRSPAAGVPPTDVPASAAGTWHQLWIEPVSPVADEQAWVASIDAALHRGGKGYVMQTEPPHDTSYAKTPQGYELYVHGDDSAYAEVVRALSSFSPAGRMTGHQSHT